MALPDSLVLTVGTAIIFGDTGTHNPAAANDLGAITDEITLTDLAAGAAIQSDKADLLVSRSPLYSVMAAIEFATAPAAGELVTAYWGPSPSGVAAQGNPGGIVGVDGAYTGYGALAAALPQLQLIGSMSLTTDATGTIQVGVIGTFSPLMRYGTLVVVNSSAADDFHSDVIEISIAFIPVQPVIID